MFLSSIGSYFSQSCAPGSPIDSNLCKLCIGDPQNPEANTTCSLSDKEAYYGSEGAIRCLVEKGDVAFVMSAAIFENTDGKNPAPWAKDLKSTDFELLCLDGSRAPVSDYRKCKLFADYKQIMVSRPESVSDVVRISLNQQSLYGRTGFQKDIFQLFSSSHGKNLLFRDGTQCLVEFDRMLDRDIVDDFFGKPFHKIVFQDNKCLPKSVEPESQDRPGGQRAQAVPYGLRAWGNIVDPATFQDGSPAVQGQWVRSEAETAAVKRSSDSGKNMNDNTNTFPPLMGPMNRGLNLGEETFKGTKREDNHTKSPTRSRGPTRRRRLANC
ncbi:unnamed protein product [Ranitomeya imitator]|uniref:Transferrin-like domain-containing protein n=1 Tax=Ranitomeya imitator TaxID=111125 RepID=A0ABN9L9L5_9NEOB|nr:unnamed protein product [Ranitomeya imitator]